MESVSHQRSQIQQALKELAAASSQLPISVPSGTLDGWVSTKFNNREVDPDEGPWHTLDRAFVKCFQADHETIPLDNVLRGPHGMGAVICALHHFIPLPEMDSSLILALNKINDLTALVVARYVRSTLLLELFSWVLLQYCSSRWHFPEHAECVNNRNEDALGRVIHAYTYSNNFIQVCRGV